jgi:hypothetical protein
VIVSESVDDPSLTLTLSSSSLSVSESPRNTEKQSFMMEHSYELTQKFKQRFNRFEESLKRSEEKLDKLMEMIKQLPSKIVSICTD